jgi:L-threonate 2-dehydrogenase
MTYRVTVIGIGAMGGGMARALLRCESVTRLTGYDRSEDLMKELFHEVQEWQKASEKIPQSLDEAITPDTNVVLLVLVNEAQCEQVCFGCDGPNLLNLLAADSYVISCSTVSPSWSKNAETRFRDASIRFVDCPISGGPVRAHAGDLTLMVTDEHVDPFLIPLLQCLARDIHRIRGASGSTAKMVHQLLAGVHICVAAEAMALAAKAGLDPQQLYEIVPNAAGSSWMFQDRGVRMMMETAPVRSALEIFVKDLDIVYSEAKKLQTPIPIASAALQQFISGQALGLSRSDDSQVVKVYENVTGVRVAKSRREGSMVGEYWKMEDGTMEEIVEVGSEPRHKTVLSNEFVRVLRVSFPPKDTTLAHRHSEDSLYFFLVEGGLEVVNHVQGSKPQCDCMGFGEVRFGKHKSEKPLVHKITNMTNTTMLCIDAEVLKQPPVTAVIPLLAPYHECIKIRDSCRVYKLTLSPGENVTVSYAFFYLTVVLKPSSIKMSIGSGNSPGVSWITTHSLGDVAWNQPVMDLSIANVGEDQYEVYIAEWR